MDEQILVQCSWLYGREDWPWVIIAKLRVIRGKWPLQFLRGVDPTVSGTGKLSITRLQRGTQLPSPL